MGVRTGICCRTQPGAGNVAQNLSFLARACASLPCFRSLYISSRDALPPHRCCCEPIISVSRAELRVGASIILPAQQSTHTPLRQRFAVGNALNAITTTKQAARPELRILIPAVSEGLLLRRLLVFCARIARRVVLRELLRLPRDRSEVFPTKPERRKPHGHRPEWAGRTPTQ